MKRTFVLEKTPNWQLYGAVIVLSFVLFSLNLFLPSDFMNNDQQRPAAYVMDLLINGNYLVQMDHTGDVMSKPPLSTWITALIALPFQRINIFLLYLPSMLGTLSIALLILYSGSNSFGRTAGFLGAIVYLVSMVAYKQMALARTDPLFATFVFFAAIWGYFALAKKKSWKGFWIFIILATLTKGPLGIILAAGGLTVLLWKEYRKRYPIPIKPQIWGFIGMIFILAIWFGGAYLELGQPLIDKMIHDELLGHAVSVEDHGRMLSGFYKPTLYYLSRFAPWSLIAFCSFIQILKKRKITYPGDLMDRYLLCYFLFGIIIFSVPPHQRPDHLFPLIPATALLAGKQLQTFFTQRTRSTHNLFLFLIFVPLLFIAGTIAYTYTSRVNDRNIQRTRQIKIYAQQFLEQVGPSFPFIYHKTRYGIQFHLNSMSPLVSAKEAALVLNSEYAAFVLTTEQESIKKAVKESVELYFFEYPSPFDLEDYIVISNRPELQYYPSMATIHRPFLITMEQVEWKKRELGTFHFKVPNTANSSITVKNISEIPETFSYIIHDKDGKRSRYKKNILPGAEISLVLPEH